MYTFSFTHAFEYSGLYSDHFKPIIPVVLNYNGNEYTFPMLVDSGAISSALPPECAEGFGIELTDLAEDYRETLGKRFLYRRLKNVKLSIGENIDLVGPIDFLEGLNGWPYGVLGREVVFDSLRIAFRQNKGPYVYMALEDEI